MKVQPRAIPVIMYHGVGDDRTSWQWNFLLTPLDVFEGQMRALKERGWTTISLDELHAHMATGAPVPAKSIVLTFDDGYRDNWVFAFPILKKYGHRAVIWMSTDFVDPRPDLSPTLEDVWSKNIEQGRLDARGYLSWTEMRRMVESGLIEIQSHATTHTWYPSGPDIIDFHRPEGRGGYRMPMWLAWNRFPDEKYKTMHQGMSDRIPYGTPIYQYDKSLVVRRYVEDPALANCLVSVVAENGGGEFFSRAGWREKLTAVVRGFGKRADRFETEEEYRERTMAELVDSRKKIEDVLGVAVRFLCWPGGAHDAVIRKMAREAGYVATTTSYEDETKRNVFGDDPSEINRIGSSSPWVWRGKVIRKVGPGFFLNGLDLFTGARNSLWKRRAYKLHYVLRYYVTGIK